jgi:CheY-like chemotaxis protein
MHHPPLILVADDNETNRYILRTRLRSQGYELLEAADGQEALSVARRHHPDLILLDVMMPKINGVALNATRCAALGAAGVSLAMTGSASATAPTRVALFATSNVASDFRCADEFTLSVFDR